MSLPTAADYIGKLTGQPKPNVSTIWRWCLKGCKGVKLESVCIGSKRFVTASAIERFIAARSEPSAAPPMTTVAVEHPTSPRTTPQNERRREEIEAARRKLDQLTGRAAASSSTAAPTRPSRSA